MNYVDYSVTVKALLVDFEAAKSLLADRDATIRAKEAYIRVLADELAAVKSQLRAALGGTP